MTLFYRIDIVIILGRAERPSGILAKHPDPPKSRAWLFFVWCYPLSNFLLIGPVCLIQFDPPMRLIFLKKSVSLILKRNLICNHHASGHTALDFYFYPHFKISRFTAFIFRLRICNDRLVIHCKLVYGNH